MTKLLTALLIAGLSATAKAEPVVYYCNTYQYAQVDDTEVADIIDYPIKLFIDREKRVIKVAGNPLMDDFTIDNGNVGGQVVGFYPSDGQYGEDAFAASSGFDGYVEFRNGVLAVVAVNTGIEHSKSDFLLNSYLADCDKF